MNHTPLRPRVAPLALLLPPSRAATTSGAPPPPLTPRPEPAPSVALDPDGPSACDSCHVVVVEEWRASMHARAHHDADPLYGAMRRLRMGREGEALAARCAQCHGPRAPERPDSAAARVGVGCAACHLVASVDMADGARKGAHAVRWADGLTMRGPHDVDAQAPAPHGVGAAAPWLTDGRTMCLKCHQATQNAAGVDTCTTGTEHTGAEGCASCHMPAVEGAS
ncbi:MAG: multiheme c-type cytochrome, partial [Sandaracinaceae bacterium]